MNMEYPIDSDDNDSSSDLGENRRLTRTISPDDALTNSFLDESTIEGSSVMEDSREDGRLNTHCNPEDIDQLLVSMHIGELNVTITILNENDSDLIEDTVVEKKPIAEVQPFKKVTATEAKKPVKRNVIEKKPIAEVEPFKKVTATEAKKPVKSNVGNTKITSSKKVDKMELGLDDPELHDKEHKKHATRKGKKEIIEEKQLDVVESVQTNRPKRGAKSTHIPKDVSEASGSKHNVDIDQKARQEEMSKNEIVNEVKQKRALRGKQNNSEDLCSLASLSEPKTKTNSKKQKDLKKDNKLEDISEAVETIKKQTRKAKSENKSENNQVETNILKDNNDTVMENKTSKKTTKIPKQITTGNNAELKTSTRARQRNDVLNKVKGIQEEQPLAEMVPTDTIKPKESKRQAKKDAPLSESNLNADVDKKPKKETKITKTKAPEKVTVEESKITKGKLAKGKNNNAKSNKENETTVANEEVADEPVKISKKNPTKGTTKNTKSNKEGKENQNLMKEETVVATRRTTRKK